MDVSTFMGLFEKEVAMNRDLHSYYKLKANKGRYLFRRTYIEQRLQYIADHIPVFPVNILDAGCGYATTSIFLTLRGHKVCGNTIEHYDDIIRERLDYWKQFGDLGSLEIRHENLFNHAQPKELYDVILLQDTFHHLEPVEEAAEIFYRMLKPLGKLVVVEENGNCIFIIMKNVFIRGFKKTSVYFDQRTGESILFGNENARGIKVWLNILRSAGFACDQPDLEFIRFFPPCMIRAGNYLKIVDCERKIARNKRLIRKFFYFGINFTVGKT